jgi:hypothetical protein
MESYIDEMLQDCIFTGKKFSGIKCYRDKKFRDVSRSIVVEADFYLRRK